MSTWTKWVGMVACSAAAAGCTVTIEEGDIPSNGGSMAGAGGGSAGEEGQAGTDVSMAGSPMGGSGGADMDAGTPQMDSMSMFPTPTCDEDPADNACEACLKQKCCTAWVGCDTALCAEERTDIAACVAETMALDMSSYGQCVSDSVMMGIPESSTLEVLDCINSDEQSDAGTDYLTRCGIPCFGQDYIP